MGHVGPSAGHRVRGRWLTRANGVILAHNKSVRFLRWYFVTSLLVALTLPLIALAAGALGGTSATEAALTVLGYEGWWAIIFWIPLTAISIVVCFLLWVTRFLPWVDRHASH